MSLQLAYGLAFEDLYRRAGLVRLDDHFTGFLETADAALAARLRSGRADPEALDAKAESQLLLDLAPHLERFLSQLFGIADEVLALAGRHDELAPLYTVKRQFVQRRAGTRIKPAAAEALDGEALERELGALFGGRFDELAFATHVDRWLADESGHARELDLALKYAGWALHTAAGRARHHRGQRHRAPRQSRPWQRYVEATEARLERSRTFPRAAIIEAIAAAGESIHVPSGTISDWRGAVFIPRHHARPAASRPAASRHAAAAGRRRLVARHRAWRRFTARLASGWSGTRS